MHQSRLQILIIFILIFLQQSLVASEWGKPKENEKKCDKMSSHIDFINSIYEKLRAPIEFISDKFKLISNE